MKTKIAILMVSLVALLFVPGFANDPPGFAQSDLIIYSISEEQISLVDVKTEIANHEIAYFMQVFQPIVPKSLPVELSYQNGKRNHTTYSEKTTGLIDFNLRC